MIQQTTAPTRQTERITCDVPGPLNEHGAAKLLATIVPTGILVWCRHCKQAHLLERNRVMEAWERGESVQREVNA